MNLPPILFNNEKFPSLFNQTHSQIFSSLHPFQTLCKKLLKYQNKESNFELSITSWLKSLSTSQLFKIFSFKNHWLVDILHELVLIHNSKPYLKFRFAPGPNPPISEREPQDTKPLINYLNFLLFNKESPKFSDYFNIVDSDIVMLTRGRSEGEQRRQELVDSIRYVTLNSSFDIKNYKEDENNFFYEYNNVVTLSYEYLKNIDNIINTFQIISDKSCFKNPIEIESATYTTEEHGNATSKNYYNFKMPKWLKKEFTFAELLCAYFEQCIVVNFMYYKMYKQEISILYYDKFEELIDNNKKLIEFIKTKDVKITDIMKILHQDEIKKTITDNPKIKKLICEKQSKDSDIRNSYIGNYSYFKKHTIKTIVGGCLNTLEKMFIRGELNFVLFLNFIKDNIVFTTEDFAIKAIGDIINNYWKSKLAEDLLSDINNNNSNNNDKSNKKKKRRKKKKKKKNEENLDENDKDDKKINEENNVVVNNEDIKNKTVDENIKDNIIIIEEKNNKENIDIGKNSDNIKINLNEKDNIENKEDINQTHEENKNSINIINNIIKEENNISENIILENKEILENNDNINNKENNISESNKESNTIQEINNIEIVNKIEEENSHKKKKEKDFFLFPTVKDGSKKKKNKQKQKKNSLTSNNCIEDDININIDLNKEDDKIDLISDKATTSTKEEEENKIIIDTEEKTKEKEKYNKKNKTEYEYTSSKQKNKFNMGIKIKKLIKDNSNLIIPKNFHPQNQISINNINAENNNFLIGSNLPRFTSFNFHSKKKRNYRNNHYIYNNNNFIPNNIVQLSQEIIDNTIKVNNNKKILQQIRDKYIKKIYENINIILRNSKIEFQCSFYGSSISGLSIENSDVDIMVKLRKNHDEKNYINKIMDILVENLKKNDLKYIKDILPISSASVPVIKLNCDLSENPSFFNDLNTIIGKSNNLTLNKNDINKLFFDITFFETENELEKIPSELMIDYIKKCTLLHPQIFDIVYIMKRFLYNKKLNKSYQGGISSYSLFLMTLAFIKKYKSTYDIPIGSLFIEYLYFYSNFNFYNTLIQPKEENNIFENIENNLEKYSLNIIDPITGLNVAKSTFKIDQVQKAFREGFDNISNNLFEINIIGDNNFQENKKILDDFFYV